MSVDTIAYVRVSTEQQATEDRTSLAEQRRAILERARLLGRVVADDALFVDPGVSGATAEGRPGFMAMVHYCESNERKRGDGIILVLNDSRWGRFDDPEEAGHWRFVLKKLGWVVRFCEGDDIQDGTARSVLRLIGSAQASEYRANLRRTAKRASRATAEAGRWGCEAPLGYRRLATRSDGAQRVLERGQRKADDEVVRLTPGPEGEGAAVVWAFERYAKGDLSLYGLACALKERVPVRSWSTTVVRTILTNPAYVGDIVHGRKPASPDGTQRRERDASTWTIVPNAHEALISRELYAAVQRRLAEHRRETRAVSGTYLLSGLLRCECGQNYHGGGGPSGPPHDPGRWRFYRCRGAEPLIGTCARPLVTVNQRWAERVVIEAVAEIVTDPSTIAVIRDTTVRALDAERAGAPGAAQRLQRERDRTLAEISRVVRALASDVLTEREAAGTLAELRASLAAADAEIARLASRAHRTKELAEDAEAMIQLAASFPSTIVRLAPPAQRRLLSPWLAELRVEKASRTLILRVNQIAEGSMLLDSMGLPGLAEQDGDHLTVERRFDIPGRGHRISGGAA